MKSGTLIDSLVEIGLNELDAKIYEYLLVKKDFNVTMIAKNFQIQRQRVYQAFISFENHGLLKKRNNNKLSDIELESPTKISISLQDKEFKLKKLSQDMAKIIPALLKEYDSTLSHPTIRIYQGKDQFIQLMNQILVEESHEILHFGSNEHIVELLGLDYANDWVSKRVANNIKTKEIVFPSHYIRSRQDQNTEELREVKWTPVEFSAAGSYLIFANKVALWNSLLPKMIVVEDAIIVQLLRTNFELIWSLL